MSLIVPTGPDFTALTHNMGATATFSFGGTVTASGSVNTKGATAALIGPLTHDVEYIVLGFAGSTVPSVLLANVLVDIMVDPAGGTAWSVLIPDLLAGWSIVPSAIAAWPRWYHFPISVTAGSSLGIRSASSAASFVLRQVIYAYGGNRYPGSWWCGTSVSAIGITAATSKGTDHTAGNAAFSAWANLGAATTHACGALQFGVGGNTDNSLNNDAKHWEFGIGSTRIGPPLYHGCTTTEQSWVTHTGPIFYSAPAGAQFMARGMCNVAAEAQDLAIYTVH